MAKYNVGIIGYGWAATAHIDAINACPDAEVVAIYSSRSLDADELKHRYGSDITPYRDVKKLIADENVNVVDICSYPYQHANQAIAAAEAGNLSGGWDRWGGLAGTDMEGGGWTPAQQLGDRARLGTCSFW